MPTLLMSRAAQNGLGRLQLPEPIEVKKNLKEEETKMN